MESEIVLAEQQISQDELDLQPSIKRLVHLAQNCRSANTRRAYSSDWKHFQQWCENYCYSPLPALPLTVALYADEIADTLKIATLKRRLISINYAHKLANYGSPVQDPKVRDIIQGLIREKGSGSQNKSAITIHELKAMVSFCGLGIKGRRDKALILVGFMGAFRRSELVSLEVLDIEHVPQEGIRISIRKSKTDQMGEGRVIGIPYGRHAETCPVLALRAWLKTSQIDDGPLFPRVDRHGNIATTALTDKAVASVVKALVSQCGLDPSKYAGHSLRSGFCTSAAAADVPERLIMLQTGHRSVYTVRRYIQQGTVFTHNAGKALDL